MDEIKPEPLRLQRWSASGCFFDDRTPKEKEADKLRYTLANLENRVGKTETAILAMRDLLNKLYSTTCPDCIDREEYD